MKPNINTFPTVELSHIKAKGLLGFSARLLILGLGKVPEDELTSLTSLLNLVEEFLN